MEEQHESLLTYLPHDLINDIIIENESTDVESPSVNIKRKGKNQFIWSKESCPNLINSITPKNLSVPEEDFKIKTLSQSLKNISPFYLSNNSFMNNSSHHYPIKNYLESNPNQYNNTFSQFCNKSNTSFSHLIMSYAGSQYFQTQLSTMTPEEISKLLYDVSGDIKDIMCNCYGNYFFQKIIKISNQPQRVFIIKLINKNFVQISKNISGTHCIQTFIDYMASKEEEKLIKHSIKTHLLDLSLHPNSTHIIQKLLCNITQKKRGYLIKFILSHFLILSKNLNGATVVKRFISEVSNTPVVNLIVNIVENNCMEMCKDQYANYVVQYAIETFGYNLCEKIIQKILFNIIELGLEKYSSNVIDKIVVQLKLNNFNQFQQLVSFLFLSKSNFYQLNSSKFGQYVLINIIKLISPQYKHLIRNTLINDIQFCESKCKKVLKCL